jgi:hypothetical protein
MQLFLECYTDLTMRDFHFCLYQIQLTLPEPPKPDKSELI